MQQFYIQLPYKTQNNIFLNMSYLNITWRKFEEILKELKHLRSSCSNFILNEYTGVLSTDMGKVKFTLTDSNSVFYFKLFDFFSDHCIAATWVDKDSPPSEEFLKFLDQEISKYSSKFFKELE